MRRRDLLVIGPVLAVALAIPPYLRSRAIDFEFEPLDGYPGFRRLIRGELSGGIDIFAGLTQPAEPHQMPQGPLCTALFGTSDWTDPTVPVAVFGDVNCPNCAAFERRLDRVQQDGAAITIMHHQLPLLGAGSVRAARVILAAGLQGHADAVYKDLLNRALRPGPAGTRAVADRHMLDGDRLWDDSQGPEVADLLGKALGLGAALGIFGTPSTMIGRTLVIGAIPENDLIRLIDLELSDPSTAC